MMSVSSKSGVWLYSLSALFLAGCSSLGGAREPTPSERAVIERVVGMAFSPTSDSQPREILLDSMLFPELDSAPEILAECSKSAPLRQIHEAFGAAQSEIFQFSPTSRSIQGLDVQKGYSLVGRSAGNQTPNVSRMSEGCPKPLQPYTDYGPIRLKTIPPSVLRYTIRIDALDNIKSMRSNLAKESVFQTDESVLVKQHCSVSMNQKPQDGHNVQMLIQFDKRYVQQDSVPSSHLLACGARGFLVWLGLNRAANLPSNVIITGHAPFFRTSYERTRFLCPPPLRYPGYYMLKNTPLFAFYARNVSRLKKSNPGALLTKASLRGTLLTDLETVEPLMIDMSERELKSLDGCGPEPVQVPAVPAPRSEDIK